MPLLRALLCFGGYSIESYSPIELANYSTNLGKGKTPLRQYAWCKGVSSILVMLWFIVPPCALTVNNFNTSCKQRKCSQQPSGVEEATSSFTQKRFTDLSGHRGSCCPVIQKEKAGQMNNCVKYTFTDSRMWTLTIVSRPS